MSLLQPSCCTLDILTRRLVKSKFTNCYSNASIVCPSSASRSDPHIFRLWSYQLIYWFFSWFIDYCAWTLQITSSDVFFFDHAKRCSSVWAWGCHIIWRLCTCMCIHEWTSLHAKIELQYILISTENIYHQGKVVFCRFIMYFRNINVLDKQLHQKW